MKRNWEYKKLGDVCTVVGGSTPKTNIPEYWGGGNYWVTPAELTGDKYIESTERTITDEAVAKTNLTLLPVGTVLLSSRAPIGKVCITRSPMYCNQGFKNIVCSKSLYNEYVYWWLKGKTDYLNSLGVGATFKEISKRSVEQIVIPVPPLEEQSRIVAELDLLTGIIDKQNAQLKELDNLALAIFYDMFGDPIENPKGWDVKKLGDLSTSVSYGTSSPSSTVGKYKYLRMNNITYEGFLDLTDLKYIDMDDAEFEKYSVREGDVLFNRTNSMDLIGKTTYIHDMEPMIIAGYIIRVRLADSVLPVYVSKFMNTPAMKKKLRGMAKGAVNQANINSKELKSIDILIPPLALQQSFAEKIQSIEKQKETIRASIADTQKLLDYTMDKYFG